MDRRTFIQQGCLACSAFALPALLQSCAATAPITGEIQGTDLLLPATAFRSTDGSLKHHVVATHAQLKQPIAVFTQTDGTYHAVLMRCTHKGVELRITGERLECSAHGSTFDARGSVLEGPASDPLRSFPVVEHDGMVRISLKA